MTLEEVSILLDLKMAEISKYFKPYMKLTIVARDPKNDEAALIKTDDELFQVMRIVGIYAAKEINNKMIKDEDEKMQS